MPEAGHGFTWRAAAAVVPVSGLSSVFSDLLQLGRRTWFKDARYVQPVVEQLLQHSTSQRFDVSAYCFMPDHVHLLVEATSPDSDLRRLMNAWKQKTGYEHRQRTRSRLWQNGYYDDVLRHDEDRLRVIAYLLANPLRVGLIRDVREYPFWGSSVWEREQLIDAIQHPMGNRVRAS